MSKVLLTGGSGFIASHILNTLLEHGFGVVFTVRSESKGRRIVDVYPDTPSEKLSFVVVEDIAKEGAFDEAVKSDPPFNFVIHTASPYHFNIQDPVKDFLEPAINGTTGIIKAVMAYAPTVKRVVLTSSFATIVNPWNHAKVYDETMWGPVTREQAMDPTGAYRGSKILAEKTAWELIETQKPQFDLVTIHPPMVYGPVPSFLNGLDSLNTSNHRIRAMIQGETKNTGLPPTAVYLFTDVRDVALAHVRALEVPQAGGQRYFVVGGHYSNKMIADTIRRSYPQLAERLPAVEDTEDDTPPNVYGYDNRKSREVLGLTYGSIEECVKDTVASMLALEAGQGSTSN